MRTYKEPKRIDKPQMRDSAIRQLNADASKFAAIRSAAISMQEEANEVGSSKSGINTTQHHLEDAQSNHQDQDDNNSAIDYSLSSHNSIKPGVDLASNSVTEDLPCEDTNVMEGTPEDRLNSSYSSSSIPTDSVISSSSKSDLDLSFNSTENNMTNQNEENTASSDNQGLGFKDKSKDGTESTEFKNVVDSAIENNHVIAKKKASPKQKQKVSEIDEKEETSSANNIKKRSPKGVKKKLDISKKKTQNTSDKTPENRDLVLKPLKPRGRPKLAKSKKKLSEVQNDIMDVMQIDTNLPCDSSAAVSPRSSKRTPKKNRKYDSDEEGGSSRKSSPRAGKKRKLIFDMEDEEFEEGLVEGFDVKDTDIKENTKTTNPPKKVKKQLKSNDLKESDLQHSVSVSDEEKKSPLVVKRGRKKRAKLKTDDHLEDEKEENNHDTQKDPETDDEKKSINKVKRKVGKKGPKKVKEIQIKASSEQDVENQEKSSDSVIVKKKCVRKKSSKIQERSKEDSEIEDGDDKDNEDDCGANDESNSDKKDQVAISCPLCGHISHSKSANTRHIKRCVEIPQADQSKDKEQGNEEKDEKPDECGSSKGEETEVSKVSLKSKVETEISKDDSISTDNDLDVSLTEEEIHFLAKDFASDYTDKSEKEVKVSSDKKENNVTVKEFPNSISEIIKRRAPNSLFICEHCDYCTPKRAMLGRHLRIHGIFVCLRCNYICDSRDKLKEHVLEIHKDRADYKLCRNCCRYVKCADMTIEQHMETCQGPVPFVCPHCEKEFKYESSLKSHIIRHNPDAPKKFHCPQCSYESNYKANLKKHLKNIHSDKTESELKCPFVDCEKVFHTQDNLKRHFKFHSDDRPHPCTKCDKKFKTAAALRGHLVVHSPSRPFKCNINDCTKDFRSKKLLKNHKEEFHNLTDKKYACEYVGCDFAFFKRSHLERHKITHTGERKFGCNVCGKAFRHSDNLKVHMRQHTNEKPVKCHLCNFACRQKSSLQYHLRKFHQIINPSRVSQSSEAQNLSTLVSAVLTSMDEGVASSVSSDSKENQDLAGNKEDVKKESFSPLKKPQNAMDLYEFRSDEEFDDDSLLMPLRQDRTSTPLRPEKYSSQRTLLDDLSENSINKNEKVQNVQQMSTVSEKNSGEIVESIKIEDIIIEEVVKFAEDNDNESNFSKCEQPNEIKNEVSETPVKVKKKPGRKKKVDKTKLTETENVDHDRPNASTQEHSAAIEKSDGINKAKGKRGRKPKALKLAEQNQKSLTDKSEENPPVKPPRKKPGPKPKKDREVLEAEKPAKVPKKRGPKKKKIEPVDDNTDDQEDSVPPKKKRKYTKRKYTGKKPGRKPKGTKVNEDDNVEEDEEEETIIYSELDQNTGKEDEDDGEATEIEGFDDEDKKSPVVQTPEAEREEEEVEKGEEQEIEEEEAECQERILEPNAAMVSNSDETEKSDRNTPFDSMDMETVAVVKTDSEEKKSEEESERLSSGIDTDFEDDLKPPPAPRPPPVVDSDEGDIESGPEEMDTPGRDFESTPPKSVQNHSVQSLRDYESTPPKSVQPDSVPNYGSIENKNDVLSPEIQQPSSQQPSQTYTEDRTDLSNPVPSNISYPPPGSVELPGSEQSVPQAPPQSGAEYVSQSDSTMPEVDKDYLGQYLQQFDSNRVEDEGNRLIQEEDRPAEHINIPTSPQKELSTLNISSPGGPPLNLSTSSERGDTLQPKGTDMSNKRMEILEIDRQHEEHFQTRTENSSRSSERIPDNVYDSISSMNSYLPPGSRETPNLFPPTSTSAAYMPFTENDAILQRQRMTTPFLAQNDQNALQNLHRMADSALAPNNSSALLRRPTTVPSREDIFTNSSAVAQSMARNPFHSTWSSQDVRHPHWPQTPYLQRSIDRQAGTTTNPLFGKDNYLPGRDFVFETQRRSMTERNMFQGLTQSQRPELSHESFPSNERFEFGYFGLPGYPGAPPLDYTRTAGSTSQKTFDERYRQPTDFRGLPQSSTSEMFRSMNSSFNFDKYMYSRDPVYHPQHMSETTNSPFLPHGVPTQHAMFDRDYTRGFYQNGPYSFMNDKPYAAAAAAASAKLSHTTTPGMGQDRDFVPRPNTAAAAAADSQIQDPYRHPMLYNMMNRYFE